MQETDKAWAAGIIDGEGSIFITKKTREDRERDTNYVLRVSVQSTDPYMTAELKRLWPEGAEFTVHRDHRKNNSDTMKWQLGGKRAAFFLETIRPYMRVKAHQADLAMEFQSTAKKHWRQMTEQDYKNQEDFYFKLKQAKVDLKIGKLENLNGFQTN